ncbi:MAG: hypothetical protein ACKPE3_01490 [Sphaerospermopsis kisseleviana]
MLRPVSYEGVAFDAVGAYIEPWHSLTMCSLHGNIEIKNNGVEYGKTKSSPKPLTVATLYYSIENPEHKAIQDQWKTLFKAWKWDIINHLNYLIQQALNAPVLATHEVLENMPEGAWFEMYLKGRSWHFLSTATPKALLYDYCDRLAYFEEFDEKIRIKGDEKIRPINYIAQQYLLQFTTEGERHESVH